jgi:uncharacterized OsmC-like protein
MTQQYSGTVRLGFARSVLAIIVSLTSVFLIGCGESTLESANPVAPSSLADATQSVGGDAVPGPTTASSAFGTLDDSDSDSDEDSDDADSDRPGRLQDNEINGAVATAATGCPGPATFTVTTGMRTVEVRTSAATVFRNGSCEDLRTVGTRVQIRGRRTTMNGPIEATQIEIRRQEAELEGAVVLPANTVGGGCPANFTLSTSGGNVTVRTSTSTIFDNGACGNLVNGARIEVRGRRAADGSVDATRIEFQRAGQNDITDVQGIVILPANSTGCPASFTLATLRSNVTVRTSGSTLFNNGACANLVNGARVEVRGRRAADGSIDATRIDFRVFTFDDDEDSDRDSDD